MGGKKLLLTRVDRIDLLNVINNGITKWILTRPGGKDCGDSSENRNAFAILHIFPAQHIIQETSCAIRQLRSLTVSDVCHILWEMEKVSSRHIKVGYNGFKFKLNCPLFSSSWILQKLWVVESSCFIFLCRRRSGLILMLTSQFPLHIIH